MIDVAYDGSVFSVAFADTPERKTDVVEGSYDVSLAEDASAPVAVKITDMLGEEVLVVLATRGSDGRARASLSCGGCDN